MSSPRVGSVTVAAGPFDVRHGGAPGGAIVVETAPPPEALLVSAAALIGSSDLASFEAAVGGPVGKGLRVLATGSVQWGDAYRDGAGTRVTAASGLNYRPERRDARAFSIAHTEAQVRWAGASGAELSVRAALNDARDVFYPALMMDAQRDRATRVGATWQGPSDGVVDHWRVDVYHHRVEHSMNDRERQSSLGTWAQRGWMMQTVAATTNYGVQGEVQATRSGTLLTGGAQLGARHWIADNVVGMSANPMIPDVTTTNAALYVEGEQTPGRWHLRTGVRAEAWHSAPQRDISFVQRAHGSTVSIRNDVAVTGYGLAERKVGEQVSWFGGLGHGARVPDPQERYMNLDRPGTGVDWVGNPRLDVVRGTELTVGTRGAAGWAHWSARAFHQELQNYVTLARLAPAAGSPANAARTESYFGIRAALSGAEARIHADLGAGWMAVADTAVLRGVKRSHAPGELDRDLADIPPWRGRVTLRWQRAETWVELETQCAARQTRLDSSVGERPLGGYGVVHLRGEHKLSACISLSAGIENLSDRTYAAHNAYTRDPFGSGAVLNEPGRFVYAQLHWEL